MPPLILHNVPDEELYIGDDGIQRPYAMLFPQDGHQGSTRSRRGVAETGSFGKSTRRSRSRTGTPAKQRDNPTLNAADKVFGEWIARQSTPASTTTTPNRKNLLNGADDATPGKGHILNTEPTEIILRGYRNPQHQYAAINHYEQLAGRICEDYPRQPPVEQRKYKSELRDPAFIRSQALSLEERAKVNKAAGGEHWVKVTFESAEAADAAIFSSPQSILSHLVYAEPYHGLPPARDEAVPDMETFDDHHARSRSVPAVGHTPDRSRRTASAVPTNPFDSTSPPGSRVSSATMESTTLSTGVSTTISTATATDIPTGRSTSMAPEDSVFCRHIPTARKVKVLPAEQALLPQQSFTQRVVSSIPLLKWFGGSMIGNEVPRTDLGEFDWNKASLYWKLIWFLDYQFKLFRGEIAYLDKED